VLHVKRFRVVAKSQPIDYEKRGDLIMPNLVLDFKPFCSPEMQFSLPSSASGIPDAAPVDVDQKEVSPSVPLESGPMMEEAYDTMISSLLTEAR